jgi:hypothetical protein
VKVKIGPADFPGSGQSRKVPQDQGPTESIEIPIGQGFDNDFRSDTGNIAHGHGQKRSIIVGRIHTFSSF